MKKAIWGVRAAAMVCGVLGAALVTTGAHAGDFYSAASPIAALPAVDGFNGKAEAFGGSLGKKSLGGAQGALTLPLATTYGLQIDTASGAFDGSSFANVAGHLFWRNPNQGLVGLYTSYTWWDRYGGLQVAHVGAEGEFYFGRFTLQGIAGVEFGNSAAVDSVSTTIVAPGPYTLGSGTPGVQTTSTLMDAYNVRTRFFDQINLKYYINDEWVGYIGHRYLGGKNAVAFGSEYGFALGHGVKAAAFVEARAGEADAQGVWGGMKFYFGPNDKSLMARHRRDDPNNWSLDSLFGLVNSHASSASTTSPTLFCNAGANLSGGSCVVPTPPSIPPP